jgi:hypothetical protein
LTREVLLDTWLQMVDKEKEIHLYEITSCERFFSYGALSKNKSAICQILCEQGILRAEGVPHSHYLFLVSPINEPTLRIPQRSKRTLKSSITMPMKKV